MGVAYPYDGVDLRKNPGAYEIGRGEQGVFHAEPYKGELLPLWGFKDAAKAEESSGAIYQKFLEYRDEDDFVGMDVARKYIQMGWTRSLRYAKYKGGNKNRLLDEPDPEKLECAAIFKAFYDRVRKDDKYIEMKQRHKEKEREEGWS